MQFFREYNNIVIKPSQQLGGIGVSLLPKNKKQVFSAYESAL